MTQRDLGVQSLERGLVVLEALGNYGACALADLHRHTGLPKSSLRRALATLVARRFVRQSVGDGLYRSNVRLPRAAPDELPPGAYRLLQVAAPVIEELTAAVNWPSDIHVRDGLEMLIVETTSSRSPLIINAHEIGLRVSMSAAASGRAYLAFCPEDERTDLLAELESVRAAPGHPPVDVDGLLRELEATRRRGYGIRQAGYSARRRSGNRLHAISVAIRTARGVPGCVTILWQRGFMEPEPFAELHLAELQAAAEQIAAELDANGAG